MRARALWNLAGARAPFRALAVWAVLAQPAALAQPDLAPLFAPRAGTSKAAAVDAADEAAVRTDRRMVRANRDLLRAVREQVSSVGAGKLRLNLLDDVDLEATLERSTPTASGYTLSGPLDGVPFGRVVLVVNDGVTMGRVYSPEGNYSIRGTSSLQTIERMPASPWRCVTAHPEGEELARGDSHPHGSHADAKGAHRHYGTGPDVGAPAITASVLGAPSVAAPTRGFNLAAGMADSGGGSVLQTKASPAAAESDTDDGDVVDVLVVYPSFVPEVESGYANMLALIDLDIATANEAYAASGVKLRVELAAAVEVEYDWFLERTIVDNEGYSVWFSALDHLSNPQDGYLDEVHTLRDRHAADLVLMHLGGEIHQLIGRYWIAGIANATSDVSAESVEELGFAVARSGDGTAVAHELGHSMGLAHDRSEGSTNKPFPYSHGFRYWHPGTRERGFDPYGTIMSQASGVGGEEFVLAFSNPDLIHPDYDIPLGVSGNEPSSEADGPADATRHLNELRSVLANVRSRADAESCRYEVIGDDGNLPAAGGTYRLRVETESGCTWTAKGGDWVSSVSAAGGTGSGDIEYTVGANDGFQRPVELLVAGQSHLRRQTGSRPVTPVCQRSRHMAEHLMESHPDYRYEATTAGNVVIVTYSTPCHELNFDADYLASIRSLDFDGTWGTIDASHFRPSDFDGMGGLAELQLDSVGDLPAGFFDGLVGLRFLRLGVDGAFDGLSVTSIAPGAFRGLPGLKYLHLDRPQIRQLAAGSFEGLSGLLWLRLWNSQAAELKLEPGAFTGLSSLWTLRLYDNELVRLDSGVFDGLPRLRYLFLGKNSLREVEADVFRGLPRLKNLVISDNPLAALPAGLFDGLGNLVNLYVTSSPLKRLPGAIFEDLRSLEVLGLYGNELTRLEPDTFARLSNVWSLELQNNPLRSIAPRAFNGLESLIELRLRGSSLGTLPAGAFDGLRRLEVLDLSDSGVTRVEPGALDEMVDLSTLLLQKNRLQELESGTFRGLDIWAMHLQDNPGSPFQFLPTPVLHASERVVGAPVDVGGEVDPEAPFQMRLHLGVAGGSWTRLYDYRKVSAGESRGSIVGVVPDGNGPVTVTVDGIEWTGLDEPGIGYPFAGPRYRGFRVAPGPPLLLYGISDVELTGGRDPRRVDLASVFSHFLGTGIDYAVSSSDPAVAEVRVEGETLVLKSDRPGASEVTVTAVGMDGETMTRTFAVTVQVPSAPLVLSGSHFGKEGFVRLINRQGHAGSVQMTAVDDAGTRRDPVVVKLAAHGVAHFNSDDLEYGNVSKGLMAGVGFGDGDWRLEFDSALDIEALAYVRTEDGFLATMHDVAPADGHMHRIAVFNPASNTQQVSRLRVVNPGREAAQVTVWGADDSGTSPGSPVRFTVPGDAAREFDAVQLESGDPDLDGALGDGEGKWRLTVESASPLVAMSLLENTSTGHLTNLSSGAAHRDDDGVHHLPLLPASDTVGREGFVRVVNRSDSAGSVNVAAFDDAGTEFGPLELAVDAGAAAQFNSDDLELGASGKGLSGSTGTGEGDWRLELTSDLDVEVFAYVRTDDGFLTVMHDVAPLRDGRHEVVTLNPGSNADQVSSLRLVNPSSDDVLATIIGTDDTGRAPLRKGAARVTVPGRGALTLTAQDLEVGVQSGLPAWEDDWSHNALGDGRGKWRLAITADAGLLVMSLLESPTGHLTNLSSVPRCRGLLRMAYCSMQHVPRH